VSSRLAVHRLAGDNAEPDVAGLEPLDAAERLDEQVVQPRDAQGVGADPGHDVVGEQQHGVRGVEGEQLDEVARKRAPVAEVGDVGQRGRRADPDEGVLEQDVVCEVRQIRALPGSEHPGDVVADDRGPLALSAARVVAQGEEVVQAEAGAVVRPQVVGVDVDLEAVPGEGVPGQRAQPGRLADGQVAERRVGQAVALARLGAAAEQPHRAHPRGLGSPGGSPSGRPACSGDP
jgi:hypothetical protein